MTKRMSFKFKWVALVATLIVGIGSWQVLAHADSSSDEQNFLIRNPTTI